MSENKVNLNGYNALVGGCQAHDRLTKKIMKPKFVKITISFAEMNEIVFGNNYGAGFCRSCVEEQGGCEPDARNYECECCGERQVFGAEELLMIGGLEIEE